MGVGLVPIDGATDLHNAAASSAAAAFAVLCLGVQVWARRLPRSLVIGSYASIAVEVIAMFAYDGIGVFNLTVFEVVAFTLVFAWLIALVTITHSSPPAADAAGDRHLVSAGTRRRRRRPATSPLWSTRRRGRALAVVRRDASRPALPAPRRAPHRSTTFAARCAEAMGARTRPTGRRWPDCAVAFGVVARRRRRLAASARLSLGRGMPIARTRYRQQEHGARET